MNSEPEEQPQQEPEIEATGDAIIIANALRDIASGLHRIARALEVEHDAEQETLTDEPAPVTKYLDGSPVKEEEHPF